MGKIEEDFKQKFSSELAKVVMEHAGRHQTTLSKVPEVGDERLVYALLEILDFECIRYDCIGGITYEEIREFLLTHRNEVLRMDIEPPSYVGLLAGVFDFLGDGKMNPFDPLYPPELLQSLEQFKRMGAWSGTVPSRKQKFEWLHRRFCKIYGKRWKRWKLRFEVPNRISLWRFSGGSDCDYDTRTITLRGRLSVVSFLHEWGHALGLHEQEQAQAYAVCLFRFIFPEQFAVLNRDGYCLVAH